MEKKSSIHGQIVEAIRSGVLDGRYRNRLPSEAQIALRFKCSRKTAVRAMEQTAKWVGDKSIAKVVVVPGRIINIVVK